MIDYTKKITKDREFYAIDDINISIESDRGRILSAPALRRLQKKTQVFPLELNAAVRSRLTHSLEVSQTARFIAKTILKKSEGKFGLENFDDAFVSLAEMTSLLHDIGNPPFGHFAEVAINNWMSKRGVKIFENVVNVSVENKEFKDMLLKDLCSFDGNVLLGLGFIFLGISYMKEGFDTLKDAIDLAKYSVPGITGILIYVVIGIIATVVIQSSSATMAIIITALAGANILYIDALALAIGANVGTTVTAILGSLTSNQNGKRLAFGHFVFNITTGLIALFLIYTLRDIVDFMAPLFGIAEDNYSMKLALFHTIFNLLGIIVLLPFITYIVKMSKRFINDDKYKKASKPKYLSKENIKIPYNAMVSIQKEVINLYENAQKAILHAISIHTSELKTREDLEKLTSQPTTKIDTNLDDIYQNNLKLLYSEIIEFALISQQHMNKEQNEYVAQLKIASSIIVKVLKDTRDIQKNLNFYLNSKNEVIKQEYLNIKQELATFIFEVNQLKDNDLDEVETSTIIQVNKDKLSNLDIENNQRIDELIRSEQITSKMATSLINDTTTTFNICKNLLRIANILLVKDEKLRKLGEHDEV